MMDRRASGASKAKGHLPGALHCREAPGPAKQPQHHTSVYTHSHVHTHTHMDTLDTIFFLTLAPPFSFLPLTMSKELYFF